MPAFPPTQQKTGVSGTTPAVGHKDQLIWMPLLLLLLVLLLLLSRVYRRLYLYNWRGSCISIRSLLRTHTNITLVIMNLFGGKTCGTVVSPVTAHSSPRVYIQA